MHLVVFILSVQLPYPLCD